MNGHGGQYAFIDRDSATVVVITSEPNTQDDHQTQPAQGPAILKRVLDALER